MRSSLRRTGSECRLHRSCYSCSNHSSCRHNQPRINASAKWVPSSPLLTRLTGQGSVLHSCVWGWQDNFVRHVGMRSSLRRTVSECRLRSSRYSCSSHSSCRHNQPRIDASEKWVPRPLDDVTHRTGTGVTLLRLGTGRAALASIAGIRCYCEGLALSAASAGLTTATPSTPTANTVDLPSTNETSCFLLLPAPFTFDIV